MKEKSEPTSRRKRTINGSIAAAICCAKGMTASLGPRAIQRWKSCQMARSAGDGNPGGAGGKASHNSGCLIAIFVNVPRQHAGLIFSQYSSPVVVVMSAIGPSRTMRSTRLPVGELCIPRPWSDEQYVPQLISVRTSIANVLSVSACFSVCN